ncbi:MHYT domain-containing protein [Bacillus safensis]|uniref:MHYT domain-containing protein n=1 Tax=Bacillus safensis TaxID=561879 RepID=UPI00364EF979
MGAVLAGLFVNAPRKQGAGTAGDLAIVRLMAASVVMGLGLTAGYYIAMMAIRIQGRTWMDGALTSVTAVVAIVASIGVLWMTTADVSRQIRGAVVLVIAASPVLMHVAMMAALRVRVDPDTPTPDGGQVFVILFPAFVGSMLVLIVPIVALLMATDRVTAELEAESSTWTRPPVEPQQQ